MELARDERLYGLMMQIAPANTLPTFGKSSLKQHVQRYKEGVQDYVDTMPLKTYQKVKRTGVRVLGAVGSVKGFCSLWMGYHDEDQRGLHMKAVLCAPKAGLEKVVDNIIPLLPCHVSLPDLLLLGGGLLAVAAPKRVLYIAADLKERIPSLAKQGANKAKKWANTFKLRSGS